mmetsp:Transcript_14785/g.57998  ORF Transcript_14785/g.57998 Transcript_14785/m.57998 type:complete len:543 (-) Transcript_14785:60-1688(-)|eukprot:CAMPEP_0114615446 /NCGR_PEP_ID=MMETSP0168-20121206/6168_1 /TAXON_ID=95228 ORGANISM="Vannella sp., Strain DIVA3 517/6/12" /NCGR_SAMPLE_ID=MMETSP0168 /ASSEMBLY_ACC=CAM_ASM_000044 /LENGTH=542 /DNA_ID=CAMNT_0001826515 /DNA_START=27 /DNA_END=1655 /DNA_ORIENTATION=+
MRIATVLVLVCLVAAVAAREHRRDTIHPNWVEGRGVDDAHPIRLQFALKQMNLDLLHDVLMAVSDPRSPTYGQHLSIDEITDIIAPPQEDVERVFQWLEENGIYGADTVINRDWVIVDTSVGAARELLRTKFGFYRNVHTGKQALNAMSPYTIPEELENIIDFVAGIHDLPYGRWSPTKNLHGDRVGSGRVGGVVPTDIYEMYNVTVPTGSCNCNTSQAVVEFDQANYSPSDLQTFFQTYLPAQKGQVVEQVYGTNDPDGLISTEANLDVQYIMALGAFVNTSDYVVPRNPNIIDSFLDYTWYVGNQTDAPLVHSISYGEYGGQYNNNTVQRVSNEFMKMGVRGISIFVASGDNGVGCGERCTSQEFDFPSSPYCTMVGATQSTNSGEVGASFSSGGFSKDYWRPSWQEDAVTDYFNSGVRMPNDDFDQNGRGYPDVSAIGVSLEVVVRGRSEPVSGTSCSAPVFGGIIALINAERAMAGKSSMGYINPWVYQNPSMFFDITSGDNSYMCCAGFKAAAGWDPVTGLGTPNYSQMLSNALSLP